MISKTIQKNGGPYSKPEQEVLRNEVFRLHFEEGFSAVRIASKLGVNRNTVNEYIKKWYSELGETKFQYSPRWLDKFFARLELQRTRLLQILEEKLSLKERLQIEKFLSKIDMDMSSLVVKIEASRTYKQI